MPDPRLTEQRNPRSQTIDRLSPLEIVDLINAEDRMVAEAVGEVVVEEGSRQLRSQRLLPTRSRGRRHARFPA